MRLFTKSIVAALTLVVTPAIASPMGVVDKRDTVMPKKTDVYKFVLEGSAPTHITVEGDGSSDLDCYLFDGGENLVRKDDDATDVCVIDITPAWTGKFKLLIKNQGDEPNEYRLQIR